MATAPEVVPPPPPATRAEWFATLPASTRQEFYRRLSPAETAQLPYLWTFWARPAQLPSPGEWRGWLIMAGRRWGKTRAGAEWVRWKVESGQARKIALLNDTAADTRDVMVEGPSGLLSICPPTCRPTYARGKLTWPNGAIAHSYSAEAPERLRGPEHDLAWADEPAKWRNLRKADEHGGTAWDNLMFGLSVGVNPQWVATTTPRPIQFMKTLLKATRIVITRGRTIENIRNLSADAVRELMEKYGGTRLGRQELDAELLEDIPGALFTFQMFERDGFRNFVPPPFTRVVVAVDPPLSSGPESDECGIIVCAKDLQRKGYVLADASLRGSPLVWARQVVDAYRAASADSVIAEINAGGEMVETTIHTIDPTIKVKVVHASRGKRTRAEPVSSLYEKGHIDHVGIFQELETQMTSWVPDLSPKSPDRMDAMVWGFTELLLEPEPRALKLY